MKFFVAPSRQLEGVRYHSLASPARKHSGLHSNLLRETGVLKPTYVGILPFGIFSNDRHVDVPSLFANQRRRYSRIENAGAFADVLIEGAANGQQQPVESHVVLDLWVTHGSQIDNVEGRQGIQPV